MQKNPKIEEMAHRLFLPVRTLTRMLYDNAVVDPDTQQAVHAELSRGGMATYTCILYEGIDPNVPDPIIVDDYIGQIVTNARAQANERGYTLSFHITNHSLVDQAYYEYLLSRRPGTGLISIINFNTSIITAACQSQQRPCVLIDYQRQEKPTEDYSEVYGVSVQNRESIIEVMRHLIDLGHRRIGFLVGISSLTSAQERLQGYRDALEEAGLPYDPNLVIESDWSTDNARGVTPVLLALTPRPTAIVASNDLMALGAYIAIRASGLRIPDDISVTGFDDISMASFVQPPLTTVRQPMRQLGLDATNTLIDRLEGRQFDRRDHRLPTEFIIRESTGPAPNAG